MEDGGLLGFAAFKDLAVSLEEDGEAEVPLDIRDLWVVPKRATCDADIGDVYGVELEGEDEDSEDEDMEQADAVASSSSSDLPNPSAVPSTSSNPGTQLVFRYDVDEAVLSAMERGRLHEWTKVEFQAICRKHGLSVRGGKGELMERVRVHFHRLYQQEGVCFQLCHRRWNIRVVERCITIFDSKKVMLFFMLNCAGCEVGSCNTCGARIIWLCAETNLGLGTHG